MSEVAVAPALSRRELGTVESGRPGPVLMVLAGIHGNEPAGVLAVQRVLGALQEHGGLQAGRVVAFAGNLPALAAGKRYLERDLNRGWSRSAIEALQARPPAEDSPEDAEQRQLLAAFEGVIGAAQAPVVFVDLHTSSADGPPFLCLADTIDNRRLGLATGVPIILGIEETIDGASLEWFAGLGIAALAVEGGRHEHPDTIGNHEAVLWRLLGHLRMLRPGAVDLERHAAHLRRATTDVPAIVEIVHRQAISPADRFTMAPGYVNFAAVRKGQLLAHDVRGEVLAPRDCRVLLPLYQALGDDGFFLARPVPHFWLHVATLVRWLRLDRLPRFLPGVRRDPDDPLTLLVDPRIARWFVTEVFHLLGYRKERRRGAWLAFSRRWSRPHNRSLGREPGAGS